MGTCLLGRYVLDVAPRSALNIAFLGLDMTSDPLLALGAAAPKGAWLPHCAVVIDGVHPAAELGARKAGLLPLYASGFGHVCVLLSGQL